jgi:hypothetical protein
MQRRASLAVGGRMAWGFLSTMVPPPVGVELGAIVLWMADDKHSDGIMKMLEWWLQMPMLFDRNTGQVVVPTYHNRYNNPNVQNRFPRAYNPGGQQAMKDTKDFNQMLKGIEKLFSGDSRKTIDNGTERRASSWSPASRLSNAAGAALCSRTLRPRSAASRSKRGGRCGRNRSGPDGGDHAR